MKGCVSGLTRWSYIVRNQRVCRRQHGRWSLIDGRRSKSTASPQPIVGLHDLHKRATKRLLDASEWDEPMAHQAKQTILWATANEYVNDIDGTIRFSETWKLWERLIQHDISHLDVASVNAILSYWRRQMAFSVVSPKDMMHLVEGYASQGYILPTEQTYNRILHALTLYEERSRGATKASAEWAESKLNEMIEKQSLPKPSIVTFAMVMQLWVACMGEGGRKADWALSKVQALEQRRRQFQRESPDGRVQPNVVYNSTLMKAYAVSGRPHDCQALWDEWWRELLSEEQSIDPPNIQTATSLLDAWGRAGEPEHAEAVLNQLRDLYAVGKMNAPPNVVSYSAVLNAWAKSNHPNAAERAEHILRDLVRTDKSSANVVTYSTVIHAYAKQGNIRRAEELLKDMIQDGVSPNTKTFNSILAVLVRQEPFKALDIMQSMDKLAEAHGWDCQPDVVSYTTLLQEFAKRGDAQTADVIWTHMTDSQVAPDVLAMNTMLSVLAKAGNAMRAEEIFETLRESLQPDIRSYTNLLHCWAQSTQEDATAMQRRVEELADEIERRKLRHTVVSFTVLCKCYTRLGNDHAALAILERAKSSKWRQAKPNATLYTQVMKALGSARSMKSNDEGTVHQAANLIQSMLREGIRPSQASWSVYLRLIATSNLDNKAERAKIAVAWMKRTGAEPNNVIKRQLERIVALNEH